MSDTSTKFLNSNKNQFPFVRQKATNERKKELIRFAKSQSLLGTQMERKKESQKMSSGFLSFFKMSFSSLSSILNGTLNWILRTKKIRVAMEVAYKQNCKSCHLTVQDHIFQGLPFECLRIRSCQDCYLTVIITKKISGLPINCFKNQTLLGLLLNHLQI